MTAYICISNKSSRLLIRTWPGKSIENPHTQTLTPPPPRRAAPFAFVILLHTRVGLNFSVRQLISCVFECVCCHDFIYTQCVLLLRSLSKHKTAGSKSFPSTTHTVKETIHGIFIYTHTQRKVQFKSQLTQTLIRRLTQSFSLLYFRLDARSSLRQRDMRVDFQTDLPAHSHRINARSSTFSTHIVRPPNPRRTPPPIEPPSPDHQHIINKPLHVFFL